MDNQFHPTNYWVCDRLFVLGLRLMRVQINISVADKNISGRDLCPQGNTSMNNGNLPAGPCGLQLIACYWMIAHQLYMYIYIYIYIKWTVFVNVTTKSAQHAHARMIAKSDLIHRQVMRPLRHWYLSVPKSHAYKIFVSKTPILNSAYTQIILSWHTNKNFEIPFISLYHFISISTWGPLYKD